MCKSEIAPYSIKNIFLCSSYNYILCSLFIFSLWSSASANETKELIGENYFNCGAVYFILNQAYKKKGDMQEAEKMSKRSEYVSNMAKQYYFSIGKNSQNYDEYMQKSVDIFVEMAVKNPISFVSMKKYCDKKIL